MFPRTVMGHARWPSLMPDCSCEKCVEACRYGNPGWFLPGEAEKVAAYFRLTVVELITRRLIKDFWPTNLCGPCDILSPVKIIDRSFGTQFSEQDFSGKFVPKWYGLLPGRCTFFFDGVCSIHPVKPFECREQGCGPEFKQKWPGHSLREYIAGEWLKYYAAKGE